MVNHSLPLSTMEPVPKSSRHHIFFIGFDSDGNRCVSGVIGAEAGMTVEGIRLQLRFMAACHLDHGTAAVRFQFIFRSPSSPTKTSANTKELNEA